MSKTKQKPTNKPVIQRGDIRKICLKGNFVEAARDKDYKR